MQATWLSAGQPQPKDKAGQTLYRAWQDHARANGNFPCGLIARLGQPTFGSANACFFSRKLGTGSVDVFLTRPNFS